MTQSKRRKRRSEEAPGWVWMLFGLGIGLIVALGVYLNGRNAEPAPGVAATVSPPPATPLAAQPAQQSEAQPQTPAEGAPGDPPADDGEDPDRFGFYDLLPSFEVVIPEVEQPAPRTATLTAVAEPGIYVLQAGSFLTEADAETQRARLALLGIESRIQRVSIDDRAFHRVRIGPVDDLDEVNSIRRQLADADVESILMRIAE